MDSIQTIVAFSTTLMINSAHIEGYGLNTAAFIAGLLDLKYTSSSENGFTKLSLERISENTGLTLFQCRKSKEFLQKRSVLEVKKFGFPASPFFKINTDALFDDLIREITAKRGTK